MTGHDPACCACCYPPLDGGPTNAPCCTCCLPRSLVTYRPRTRRDPRGPAAIPTAQTIDVSAEAVRVERFEQSKDIAEPAMVQARPVSRASSDSYISAGGEDAEPPQPRLAQDGTNWYTAVFFSVSGGSLRSMMSQGSLAQRRNASDRSIGSVGQKQRSVSRLTSIKRMLTFKHIEEGEDEEEDDDDDLDPPPMFLRVARGDRKKACARYRRCLKLRDEYKLAEVMQEPFPKFERIQEMLPSFLHMRGRNGELVTIERAGDVRFAQLMKSGVSVNDILIYSLILAEFMYTRITTEPLAQCLRIIDCSGLPLSLGFNSDFQAVTKLTAKVLGTIFPGRCKKILLVNTPRFFSGLFELTKGLLPRGMVAFIDIVTLTTLKDYVAPENLPRHLGGTCDIPLGQSPDALTLNQHFRSMGRVLVSPVTIGAEQKSEL